MITNTVNSELFGHELCFQVIHVPVHDFHISSP